MTDIREAYNLALEEWGALCRRLNQPIRYPDGMEILPGVIYWVREPHYTRLDAALEQFQAAGIERVQGVLDALRTPRRMQEAAARTGADPEILRILKHDIAMWLPVPIPLTETELALQHPAQLAALERLGVDTQLAVLSRCQLPEERRELASRANIHPAQLMDICCWCDFYRTGTNLNHIRSRLYYAMGLNTWQKWAQASSGEVIARFAAYIRQQGMSDERLVPFPREVRNGIEWAKLHLSIFAVTWGE
ncbi:MAG TPA: DUF4332 domain-containing protein [Anaerolineaceae bacterium]|nr:DUF4332 domain-containing protein [Chloroflexota bacterium]HNZ01912.1 DUF4332 domain-containing protein [Anaerolineaceae bacterium]HOH21367.1 DUF4332 domain-containing protein [Anaerolineaceae bacterium]HPA34082.1 DUF4332 domain-containing protein [Anaerolineaceae bacterium]